MHKGGVLARWQRQTLGQAFGHLTRGPPAIGLDIAQIVRRAADAVRQRRLGQVERTPALLEPASERGVVVHGCLRPVRSGHSDVR